MQPCGVNVGAGGKLYSGCIGWQSAQRPVVLGQPGIEQFIWPLPDF